tara:strand:+ start:283 stop:1002 length:720 start_codon:yes stop_codon:yes gene_type:complete
MSVLDTSVSGISNDDGFMDISDFIYTKRNVLDRDFCLNLIEEYESDNRKEEVRIGKFLKYDPLVHDAKQLNISLPNHISDYQKYDDLLCKVLGENINEYQQKLANTHKGTGLNPLDEYVDDGYLIKSYEPGGFYTWHNDYNIDPIKGARVLTYIFYLNDIKSGGETEFIDGTRIKPQTGKLILFPAVWPFSHRALPVKNRNKYIVTGWVYGKNKEDYDKLKLEYEARKKKDSLQTGTEE